eukprot:PLAT12525.33.p1 GENE.PLAT12525.33~~PLAT12525.33.p1  ORF type:complete len:899 (-),score=435.88 PLAT12525.33:1405-4101(-)
MSGRSPYELDDATWAAMKRNQKRRKGRQGAAKTPYGAALDSDGARKRRQEKMAAAARRRRKQKAELEAKAELVRRKQAALRRRGRRFPAFNFPTLPRPLQSRISSFLTHEDLSAFAFVLQDWKKISALQAVVRRRTLRLQQLSQAKFSRRTSSSSPAPSTLSEGSSAVSDGVASRAARRRKLSEQTGSSGALVPAAPKGSLKRTMSASPRKPRYPSEHETDAEQASRSRPTTRDSGHSSVTTRSGGGGGGRSGSSMSGVDEEEEESKTGRKLPRLLLSRRSEALLPEAKGRRRRQLHEPTRKKKKFMEKRQEEAAAERARRAAARKLRDKMASGEQVVPSDGSAAPMWMKPTTVLKRREEEKVEEERKADAALRRKKRWEAAMENRLAEFKAKQKALAAARRKEEEEELERKRKALLVEAEMLGIEAKVRKRLLKGSAAHLASVYGLIETKKKRVKRRRPRFPFRALPLDLQESILCFLPHKQLGRSLAVCRGWRRLYDCVVARTYADCVGQPKPAFRSTRDELRLISFMHALPAREAGKELLIYSVCRRLPDFLRRLATVHKAPLNSLTKSHGVSPLLVASRRGEAAIAELLLTLGARVTVVDREKKASAMHMAADRGNLDVLQVLLRLRRDELDFNTLTEEGRTPLMSAVASSQAAVVDWLLQLRKEEDAPPALQTELETATAEDGTALCMAANVGCVNIMEALIAAGADVNATTEDKRSPLYLAAAGGFLDAVELLLGIEAVELDLASTSGKTPLFIAAERGLTQVVKLLLDAGAVHNRASARQKTPLYVAVEGKYKEVVELLLPLARKADLTKKTTYGTDTLFVAQKAGRDMMTLVLAKSGLKKPEREELVTWGTWGSLRGPASRVVQSLRNSGLPGGVGRRSFGPPPSSGVPI